MGKFVFMKFASESGNVKQVKVTQGNDKMNILNPTEKSEKKGGWLKSK